MGTPRRAVNLPPVAAPLAPEVPGVCHSITPALSHSIALIDYCEQGYSFRYLNAAKAGDVFRLQIGLLGNDTRAWIIDKLVSAMAINSPPNPFSPIPPTKGNFNPKAVIPFGCTVKHIRLAMNEFVEFLGFINVALQSRGMPRLESMLMQANFSSEVGEFMSVAIPKHCKTIVKNRYHNGHPDLIPQGRFRVTREVCSS